MLVLALVLSSCGKSSDRVTAPIVPGTPPPGPMVTIVGDPRVTVNFTGFVNRAVGVDTLSGYFYVGVSDSLSRRTFITGVTLNGVPMREERDPLGAPFRYNLRPVDLGPDYGAADTLQLAFHDTTGATTDFAVRIVPSTLDLPPDSTVVSQSKDLVLHWNGAAERVLVTLQDLLGTRVRANLQFENESGFSQLLIRSQDLKVLVPGSLAVGAEVLNTDTEETPRPRRVSASMDVLEARLWQLVP